MKYTFYSNFKTYIEGLLEQKHALGYIYEESERILKNFDLFCIDKFPNEITLTKDIGLAWAVIKETESRNGFRNRLMPIRELAKYMGSIGTYAYLIPEGLAPKAPRFIPHVYTNEELKAFFESLDQIPYKKNFPIRHLVIPTIFRLIYCCGLRPGEARKLLTENFDLHKGCIKILESKGHKDRNVILSDDILALCRKYYEKVSFVLPNRKYFFPDSVGNLYTKKWMEKTFNQTLKKANIVNVSGNKPRVYDFRHTFTTKTLYRWVKEGKDLTVYLPYLSAYLGHVQFSDTAYYIHLIPEFFSQMADMDLEKYSVLIPEVSHED